MQTLVTGIAFGESPRWHDGRLWFSDWVAQEVRAVDLDGTSEVITRVHAMPFSIDWLPEGPLVVTSGRSILRLEPDGMLVTHADLSGLTEYGWNEIIVDGRGNVYVNGVEFDLMSGEEARPGIIALLAPDGSARRVADGLAFPNGMAVTPDDSTLIVAESYGSKLTAFDIALDGRPVEPKGMGRPGRRGPRRDLLGRGRLRLVRRRSQQAVRACPGGW